MKRIVAQELDPSPIWPHTLKYHPVSGALIATGAVPGEEGGHYVAVWTEKTSAPTQCYKRERPCDEGTELAFSCDGKLAAIAAILEAEGDALRWASTKILPKSAPDFAPKRPRSDEKRLERDDGERLGGRRRPGEFRQESGVEKRVGDLELSVVFGFNRGGVK
ncbi:MAG: hypothetical protein IJ991_18540 [Thermoguttaceae bacterium]|nr:hypothetical protein [Thermoguttaceae bacterium]